MTRRVGLPCYDCQHQREVAGNAHISCAATWTPEEIVAAMRAASPHGVKHGWFYFPFLYDPIWARDWDALTTGPVECPQFLASAASPTPQAEAPG